ncbi:MAG TPA: hypothetical protein PLF40_12740, partial [Kofleriaceae bacterium]|nr:hypothetical protein [Kofleriaceae bacterium]
MTRGATAVALAVLVWSNGRAHADVQHRAVDLRVHQAPVPRSLRMRSRHVTVATAPAPLPPTKPANVTPLSA